LGQFLEHLIAIGIEKIIQIGGQSKSKVLEGKNLRIVTQSRGKASMRITRWQWPRKQPRPRAWRSWDSLVFCIISKAKRDIDERLSISIWGGITHVCYLTELLLSHLKMPLELLHFQTPFSSRCLPRCCTIKTQSSPKISGAVVRSNPFPSKCPASSGTSMLLIWVILTPSFSRYPLTVFSL